MSDKWEDNSENDRFEEGFIKYPLEESKPSQGSWCVYCGGESWGYDFCSDFCSYLFYHKWRKS